MSSIEPLLSNKSKRYQRDTFIYSMTLPTKLVIGVYGFQIVFLCRITDRCGTFRIKPIADTGYSCSFEPLDVSDFPLLRAIMSVAGYNTTIWYYAVCHPTHDDYPYS